MVYRVVQELLNNTLKHANAKNVDVKLIISNSTLIIHYGDDGKGFNPTLMESNRTLGLSGIFSRIDFLKGKIVVNSSPGTGCSYDIKIPIN
jgi:two-component system, NarL family, sensor kinase